MKFKNMLDEEVEKVLDFLKKHRIKIVLTAVFLLVVLYLFKEEDEE